MLVALIELNDSHRPFCEFAGVVDTPEGITHEDMPRLYRAWFRQWRDDEIQESFTDWIIQNHGCTEINCGFAILGMGDDETE